MSNTVNNFRTSRYKLPEGNEEVVTYSSQFATHNVSHDALVLDARLRQSLVTIRSLGSRGLQVAALETFSGIPAFSSRWCKQGFVCTADEGTARYFTYLEQLLDRTGARVLITSSDGTIALVRQQRERLERRVRIALAREPALGVAVNKEQTLEIARRLGMAIPRGVTVRALNELQSALHEVGLPAVIKPVESWVWGKQQGARLLSQLVTTPNEAQRVLEELTNLAGAILFQQFLPGRREAISFLYAHNQIYARFAQWAKRTQPPLGGISVLRQSIAVPGDIGDKAEQLVREIELEGYSEVEFRRDSEGKPYLMEINPRLSASVEVAVRAGVDFPYLLYQWANGDRINVIKSYRVGGWMRHLDGDIAATAAALRQRGRPGVPPPARTILDFCVSFFVPAGYDYVDWRDLLPAWMATKGFFARHLARLARLVGKGFFRHTGQP